METKGEEGRTEEWKDGMMGGRCHSAAYIEGTDIKGRLCLENVELKESIEQSSEDKVLRRSKNEK